MSRIRSPARDREVDRGAQPTAATGLPVVVDNDVNTLVANEKWFGAARGVGDVAVVSIGRGGGLGLVLDGRLCRGVGGGAGEFGHTKVADGPECACGGGGCLVGDRHWRHSALPSGTTEVLSLNREVLNTFR